MTTDNLSDVELHNIAELDPTTGYPGPLLRRYPRAVAETLENTSIVSEDAALSELRFVVVSGRRLAVVLNSLGGGDLFVYRGDFLQNHVRLPAGATYRQILDFENDLYANLRPEAFAGQTFSRHVWRVVFDGPTLLHGIDRMGAVIRPPRADEKPARRWLAYGSSITHGFSPVTRRQCYVAQTARRLGVDVINLGLGGSCMCEKAAVDYLASRTDWDFVTCEVGVNMRAHYEPDVFDQRVRYLVETLTTRHPGKPVVLISPFTSAADYAVEPTRDSRRTDGFREKLAAIGTAYASRGVHLLDGREILTEFGGLNCDFVHPSSEGHTVMAENLSARLRALGVV
jgi:lysophospholipase L1-like esterase